MKFVQRTVTVAGAALVLALVPEAALVHAHADSLTHHVSRGQVVEGILSGGMTAVFSLDARNSLSITTSQGQTVAVALTPQTHLNLEAHGSDAALLGGNTQIVISAVVTPHNGALVATQVDARITDSPRDSKDKGNGEPPTTPNTTKNPPPVPLKRGGLGPRGCPGRDLE